jgi:hypothetical protein
MKRKILKQVCHDIANELSRHSYHYWKEQAFPNAFERKIGNVSVCVELVLLEDEKNYLHIAVAVDDGGALTSIFPVSSSFIVYK